MAGQQTQRQIPVLMMMETIAKIVPFAWLVVPFVPGDAGRAARDSAPLGAGRCPHGEGDCAKSCRFLPHSVDVEGGGPEQEISHLAVTSSSCSAAVSGRLSFKYSRRAQGWAS